MIEKTHHIDIENSKNQVKYNHIPCLNQDSDHIENSMFTDFLLSPYF